MSIRLEVMDAGDGSTAILKEEEHLKDNTVALLFAGSPTGLMERSDK
ncbi:hypothetical protein ES703_27561 [subsurface metagenome]